MSYDSKFSELVIALTRSTSSGQLKWHRQTTPPQLATATNTVVIDYFQTIYNGVKLGIYDLRFQSISDDFDNLYWKSQIGLALLTPEGYIAETFYEDGFSSSLDNLYALARSSAYNVENLLNQALKNKPEA